MAEIIPRWEWRTFGDFLGPAETVLAAMPTVASTDSDELYLLAPRGPNAKVRSGLLDIKVLEEVDAHGLERWNPVMKAPVPLTADSAAVVLGALSVAVPDLERDTYSLGQFLDELIDPNDGFRVVDVHKHRRRYAIGTCMTELSDVTVNGRLTRTIAVESDDKEAVLATVHDLGLSGYRNINYQRGLTRILDEIPDRYAVIDIGTNSVKFNLGERADDGSWTTVVDRAELTRLGEGVEVNGVIQPEAVERTAAAIEQMVEEAEQNAALAIVAVATAGMRNAQNSDDVVSEIRTRTGVSVEVISGTEESRLAYLAVQAGLGMGSGSLVVFDTGGGSSQFTYGSGTRVDERFSVDVGSVRYTEHFNLDRAVTPEELGDAMDAISTDLSSLRNHPFPDALVGMGGAITNIAAVSLGMATYDPDVVQGATLHQDEVDRQIGVYRSLDAVDRGPIVGLQPKRADVILAGACIVRAIMNALNAETLTVSDRGLRHGLAVERFGAEFSS